MLHWALMFLLVALVAAIFGFGGIASTATGIAQVLFVIAIIMFVMSLLAGYMRHTLSVKRQKQKIPVLPLRAVPSSSRRGRWRTRRSLHHH